MWKSIRSKHYIIFQLIKNETFNAFLPTIIFYHKMNRFFFVEINIHLSHCHKPHFKVSGNLTPDCFKVSKIFPR